MTDTGWTFEDGWKKLPAEYYNHPPSWPAEHWIVHVANLKWIGALVQGHYSFSDPVRHIRLFRERVLADERIRVLDILESHGFLNPVLKKEILGSI